MSRQKRPWAAIIVTIYAILGVIFIWIACGIILTRK